MQREGTVQVKLFVVHSLQGAKPDWKAVTDPVPRSEALVAVQAEWAKKRKCRAVPVAP